MQCLTGAAGANNVPADFCHQQLKKQRSINWAVLPDKPSHEGGSVRPFAVIISIRGESRVDYAVVHPTTILVTRAQTDRLEIERSWLSHCKYSLIHPE